MARITKSAMSGMGFHIEWLRLSRPEATHVERAQRGPYAGVAVTERKP